MATLRAFRGLRPRRDLAGRVACRPYDVMDSQQARKEAGGDPVSFLHVIRAEIDLPESVDEHAPEVYGKARENFGRMLADGTFVEDAGPCLYIYRLTMAGRSQTGILGCASVDEYADGTVRRHELTLPAKEEDRRQHIRVSGLQAEPVFYFHEARADLAALVAEARRQPAEYDFTAVDGVRHELWVVADRERVRAMEQAFARVPRVYVADGHHRTAAAAAVGQEMRRTAGGPGPWDGIMAVHFPHDELAIMEYNRLVRGLNGLDEAAFLRRLERDFLVSPLPGPARPGKPHAFVLGLPGRWFRLDPRTPPRTDPADPTATLDVRILSERVLGPVLGIQDIRKDPRMRFSGGIVPLEEMGRTLATWGEGAAFVLHPVSIRELIEVSDAGQIMPPKSTWFEPKLRSGLVVHRLRP